MSNISTTLAYLFPGIRFSPGGDVVLEDGVIAVWRRAEPQPTPAELAAAELPAAKHWSVAANRAECSRRIYARYPPGRQLSALAGLYDLANVAAIHSCIAAENTAADAIEAATTVQAVEAVSVSWPA